MKQILTDLRDFSYLWTLKQMNNPSGGEKVRYKTKFYYIIGIYYFTFLGLILYLSRKFFRVDVNALLGINMGLKIFLTAVIIYLPIMLIGNILLRSISSFPISEEDIARKRKTYISAVLLGFALLALAVYMTTLLGKVNV
ncbi:MAG: hypothetical protein KF870_06190 [Leadbetterella sp.]|nr:hypothetical protein [Leadbetterella sp.]